MPALKWLAALLLTTIVVLLVPGRVAASPPDASCIGGYNGAGVVCSGGFSYRVGFGPAPLRAAPAGLSAGEQAPQPRTYTFEQLSFGPQGLICFGPIQVTDPNAAPLGTMTALQETSLSNEMFASVCSPPAAPPGPAPPALPPASPQVFAEQFWDSIPLPVPAPSIPPGYAITGKTAYLIAGDAYAPPAWTKATPLGELLVTARAAYRVNWGDGTGPSGPYRSGGAPYPSGTITHTYDDVATYTVTVEETWTATWTLGAAHGVLAALRTTGTIPRFVVRQIQAVITG